MVFHTNSRGQNNKQKKSNESPLQEPHCSLHVHYFEQVHNITRPSLCQQEFSCFPKIFHFAVCQLCFSGISSVFRFRQPFLYQVWHFRYFEHPRISVHYIVRRRFDRPQAVHPEQKQTAGKIRKTGHFLRNNRLIWYARRDSNPRPFGS